MPVGLKRKPLALIKRLRKAKKEAPPMEKPAVVKTHLRNMIVVPEMIGSVVGIHNGKVFNQVEIKVGSSGTHEIPLLPFFPSLISPYHLFFSIPIFCTQTAGNGGPLSWRVCHHIQASQAWPSWDWSNTFLTLHPPQVNIHITMIGVTVNWKNWKITIL